MVEIFILVFAFAAISLATYALTSCEKMNRKISETNLVVDKLSEFTDRLSDSLINFTTEYGRKLSRDADCNDSTVEHFRKLDSEIEELRKLIENPPLSEEEKEALAEYTKAQKNWNKGMESILNFSFETAKNKKDGE